MSRFDSFAVVDWSSGNDTGPRPKKDAIWIGAVIAGLEQPPVYCRNRKTAFDRLGDLFSQEIAAGRRLLIGFDFPFGYPEGFAKAVTGNADPLRLWAWFANHLEDSPTQNNRFALAGKLNAYFPGTGPFWFNGTDADVPGLPRKGRARLGHGMPEHRQAELRTKGTFSCWQMGGAGAVGGQVMTGLAVLHRLRASFPDHVSVWPFEPDAKPIRLVEIWPSLISDVVKSAGDPIKDRAQVQLLSRALAGLSEDQLRAMLNVDAPEEGWILGIGHEDALKEALMPGLVPPRLKNDCFALPPGVDWTPVDQALARLQDRLSCIVGKEDLAVDQAEGLVLAEAPKAQRANPPAANSAVDGYGFQHAQTGSGDQRLPLVNGRAAAGAPFKGAVPQGHAIRILTGALLPPGVDTVVLEEDTATDGQHIAFEGPIKAGANTRNAGEDVAAGDAILNVSKRLGPPEIALLTATGVTNVAVRKPLRVGVLSTGDEIVPPGSSVDPRFTYDANRPMLLALVRDWRMDAVDLGHVNDSRVALSKALDDAANRCDAILTSGGASAGDEDHVSALLGDTGSRADWRIALKPGRPLVLGVWNGTPVFGLPGNPVAALVCTLIFARPAFAALGGEGWTTPQGFEVPAAFTKTKKPGRREYLRARMTTSGQVEVFNSEGSGRISGLAWADGLVELGNHAAEIKPGDMVRYLPYCSFR